MNRLMKYHRMRSRRGEEANAWSNILDPIICSIDYRRADVCVVGGGPVGRSAPITVVEIVDSDTRKRE
jgi:hypothetical protein